MDRNPTDPDRPEHIGEVLPRVLRAFRPVREADIRRIARVWEGVVGAAVSENARPHAVKGGVVLVHVTGSAWIHHLQFVKADIVDKLNEALGQPMVETLTFKIGPLP